jgi:hypothetical protein
MRNAQLQPAQPPSLAHFHRMIVPAGIVQFARGMEPDRRSGTCLDDNVRAWLVALHALDVDPSDAKSRAVGDAFARFVRSAQRADGLLRNMADVDGAFLEDVGSDASFGRTIWVCGIAARCAAVDEWRETAVETLAAALPAIEEMPSTNARAYAVLGLAAALEPATVTNIRPSGERLPAHLKADMEMALRRASGRLNEDFCRAATAQWSWWHPELTWGNARLPQALLAGGAALGDRWIERSGRRALDFLDGVTHVDGMFVPIGNEGWYRRNGERPIYDQQPIEACCMVDAWMTAYRLSGKPEYRARAEIAYGWFHGRNTEGLRVAVEATGACHDGLRRASLNRNAGAESTCSYLQASYALL